ncbi:MAG TPA: M28 family peptidase, partial [Solirubrobacteraceae bacterium]|nr:M28 family peptidase [Solirubrobacteraceae bacterium]
MGTSEDGFDRGRLEGVLREVVERLAPIDRTPCSPGEREAAEWLAARLRRVAGVEVALEEEPSWGIFPPTATGLGLLGVAGAALVLGGRRGSGALLAVATLAGIVDEAQNGPRVLRRLVRRRRSTVNLIARAGEWEGAARGAATRGAGERGALGTLVVLAHHDAPQTGVLFDQTLQRRLYELAPGVLEGVKTPLPQWWFGLSGPLCTLAGALGRRRGLARAGLALGALGAALVADVWRSPTVPGANDNLSAVAALVALAEMLRERPVRGLRVLLVSCGAEETLQDGVRAFVARHRGELPPERTWFVNLDTVGSPHLVMLEAEGPIWMEEYTGAWLRDLLAVEADRLGVKVERGFRARAST